MHRWAIAAFVLALLPVSPAAAGWYRVETYTGTVGPYPVTLSLQRYDDFGSGITVEGSYVYDRRQSPIALYGTAEGARLRLCETAEAAEIQRILVQGLKTPVDTAACPFTLDVGPDGASGTWSAGGRNLPVALTRTGRLDDTGAGVVEGTVAIPFWAQTARHRFAGIYTKSDAGICMTRLQAIDKTSAKVTGEIAFDRDDCNAGMVMTSIYLNATARAAHGIGSYVVAVEFRDGRAGTTADYLFNDTNGTFRRPK
ncbi:hypothetical protein [Ancylobacter terrae]|uniref:hypothetical protein n=1 Tax=Ancylobacter sp. sgz301288 TaxID=3342077 RepID=UPI00385DE5AF